MSDKLIGMEYLEHFAGRLLATLGVNEETVLETSDKGTMTAKSITMTILQLVHARGSDEGLSLGMKLGAVAGTDFVKKLDFNV